jgi:hypothetical protein
MSQTRIKLRIFIACTSELEAEREKVHAVANELNRTLADSIGIVLEVVDWKTHVSSMMGRPQQVLFDQLPVDTWDIFVGMLWRRFGTPSSGISPNDSKPFTSGTEEEFTLAYDLWKDKGKPQMLFFRCIRPVSPDSIDPEQIKKVHEFFSAFSASGNHPGFINTYDTVEAFEKKLQADLTRILLAFSSEKEIKQASEDISTDSSTLRILPKGFLGFFTRDTNEERNRRKKDALLSETRLIRLLAHVGHSYLAKVGNKFKSEVVNSLDAGTYFQITILNPWTEPGLMIAIGEMNPKIKGINFDEQKVDFSKIDVISVIQNSTYYRYSLLQVLDEYRSLKKKYGDQISLRLATHDISATVLLTSSMGFFEPYVSVNLQQRLTKALHTFEIQYNSECYFYHTMSAYFDTLWRVSQSLEEFENNEDQFKKRLKATYDSPEKRKALYSV